MEVNFSEIEITRDDFEEDHISISKIESQGFIDVTLLYL